MKPLEVAMKLASASATCAKHKCPYAAQCKGNYETCAMKEIALLLRSQCAEIDSLKAVVAGLSDILSAVKTYVDEIEKANKRYHDIVIAFQHGYRPKKTIRKPYKPRKKKDPEEMDGDERYAYVDPNPPEPEPPMVVI